MAKGKKSALALAKERKRNEHIGSLIETWNKKSTPITPTYDELPKNSSWLNKLGETFKGTNKNKIQINYKVDF